MEGQNRARSSSTGHISNLQRSHSPASHQFVDHASRLDLNLALDPSNFATANFDTAIISSSPATSQPYNFEGSPRFDHHLVPSNDFNHPSFDQTLQPNGIATDLQPRPANVSIQPPSNPFHPDLLGSSVGSDYSTSKPVPQFNSGFLVEPAFHDGMQVQQHTSINPADIMNMSSPLSLITSPPTLMPPEPYSSRQSSPAPLPNQFYSPRHSRHTSLDPSSAILGHVQQQPDWSGMLQHTQFQGHRRAPSDHSDISSSVAPSPFLAQSDNFDFDYNPSPLMNPQQDNQLYSGLGMEQFSLSDPQQKQQHRISPGQTPFESPQMSPHMGLGQLPENFILPQDLQGNFGGGPGPDIYTNPTDPFPQYNSRHDSSDMGQAAQMTPPEINVEFVSANKQSGFEPSRMDNDLDALSPPARGRPVRSRSKSDTFISHPGSANAHSPHLTPMDMGLHQHPHQRQRSSSPFETSLSPNISRETSPVRNSRRSSMSSIPTRDYILELADPNRPPASGNDKRVQKHPATFQCKICPKRFTRAYNLRSHLRTHTDERPFICTVCGKAFARQHDRKRHEGLHSGEKKFVCRGDLGSGSSWGCARRFARADALGRHFRSEAGRVCIKPLLDEEAMERQRELEQQMMNHSMSQGPRPGPGPGTGMGPASANVLNGANGFAFPAALLAQYPDLQGLQWDQLGQTDRGDEGELSGRSSYDATSQPGDGYDDEDGEYSGGTGVGGVGRGGFGAGGGWSSLEPGEWHSDIEGR